METTGDNKTQYSSLKYPNHKNSCLEHFDFIGIKQKS